MTATSRVTLYCYLHERNHELVHLDVEKLIYGLMAGAHEAAAMENEGRIPEKPENLYDYCPIDLLEVYLDPEVYHEHIWDTLLARRTAARTGAAGVGSTL